jgi:signal recognition particle receptor subunit beta
MALFNYATKEITIKIVYYGPGLSGKTTNLQYLHSVHDPKTRGKLLSLATETDRTLFFDFLPIELGKIRDFSVRFQLYTVPGQVRYNATRKLVLRGADAIVFVADSQQQIKEQNIESLKNMRENLIANNINPDDIPLILQYNKRDLSGILSIDELNKDLNEDGKYEYAESIAIAGTGVEETFQRITGLAIKDISEKYSVKLKPLEESDEIIEAEIPSEKATVSNQVSEEPVTAIPIIESYRHEPLDIERTASEVTEAKKEPIQDRDRAIPTFVEEEAATSKEVIIKEIREVPLIPGEKVDMIIDAITEISKTMKELKDVASKLHFEIKEMKKDQKEISVMLRDMKNNFENLKTKKSWFRLS